MFFAASYTKYDSKWVAVENGLVCLILWYTISRIWNLQTHKQCGMFDTTDYEGHQKKSITLNPIHLQE